MGRLCHSIAVAVFFFAGCSHETPVPLPPWDGSLDRKIPELVRTALEQAAEFELLSLDPTHRDQNQPDEFLRRKVIGRTFITDPATRNTLLAAIDYGVRSDDIVAPDCFDPRHAIRLKHAGKTLYLTICFECSQVFAFVDDQSDLALRFYTTDSPEPVFDEILRTAGVPLAEKGTLQDELVRQPLPN